VIDGEVTLVDCGNGVVGQYMTAGLDLAKLRRILISHHHIDHVADVATLVHLAWTQLDRPVAVVGPPPLRRIFDLHYQAFETDIQSRMEDEGMAHLRDFVQITEIASDTAIEHTGARITAALVEHPPIRHAFAYRIDQGSTSICFSGDTRPTPALAALARGADLLVHETTYLANAADHLPPARVAQVLARMRAVHSDPAGAAGIASTSGAGALLLSPVGAFGPVADEEILDEARTSFSGPAWVGRDLLRVPLPVRGDT
jgi:ribonuclease BN (tRNA processing enzyme)